MEEEANKLLATLPTSGIAVEADLSTIEGPQILVGKAVAAYGQINILINNAAIALNNPLENATTDEWERSINLNGRGYFLLTQAVLPHFGAKDNRIVNIISLSARAPPPGQTIYAGTKGMEEGFTRVWAKELPRSYNCTVNSVSPGPVTTPAWKSSDAQAFVSALQPMIDSTPVAPRWGTPEEIAYAAVMLCEPSAGWINGTHVIASGGLYVD